MIDITSVKPLLTRILNKNDDSPINLTSHDKKLLALYITHLAYRLQVERKNRKRFVNACILFNNALKN